MKSVGSLSISRVVAFKTENTSSPLGAVGYFLLGMFGSPASVVILFGKLPVFLIGGYDKAQSLPISMNWMTLLLNLCCSCFCMAPMICALVLLGEYADPYAEQIHAAAIGVGLLFPVAITLMLWWQASCDEELNSTQKIKHGRLRNHADIALLSCYPWLTLSTALGLFSEVLNFYQVAALAVVPDLYPEEAPTTVMFEVAFLNFSVTERFTLLAMFWTLFGMLLVWFALTSLLVYAMETPSRDFVPIMSIPQSDALVNLLANTLNLTIMEQLMGWLDCTFYSDASQASLDQDTFHYLPCWASSHRSFGLFAVFALNAYVVSTRTLGITFMESVDDREDIRWREDWILLESAVKMILLIVQIFFTSYVVVGQIIQVAAFGTLAAYLYRENTTEGNKACSIYALSYLKGIFYFAFLWCSVVALAASLLEEPQESWVPFGVLLSALPFIGFWGWNHYFRALARRGNILLPGPDDEPQPEQELLILHAAVPEAEHKNVDVEKHEHMEV